MRSLILENTPFPQIMSLECGWGNGYTLIPKSSIFYSLHYDQIHELCPGLSVHCGLTFSNYVSYMKPYVSELLSSDSKYWMVGFDTRHYRDTLKRWPEEAVQLEADRLTNQLQKVQNVFDRKENGRKPRKLKKALLSYPNWVNDRPKYKLQNKIFLKCRNALN